MSDETQKVVRAGDGSEVFLTDANGPINRDGSHAALEEPETEKVEEMPTKRGPIKSTSK